MRRLRPRLAEDSFLVLLKYTGKNLCHVVYFIEDIVRDVEGFAGHECEYDGVAGSRVEFDDFFAEFIFHRDDESSEEGAVFYFVDYDAIDFGSQPIQQGHQ